MTLTTIHIDASNICGALELWRHAPGHGGINSHPLPARVVEGTRKLKPRLIRIFLQEFFRIYPTHGVFDWSRLDPYMDALAATGANVMAAITIKPSPLYPQIDARVWRPTNGPEWQRVITELVGRYSVDRPLVTHWEIGNEVDIGEDGGCPYLIRNPEEYTEYFRMTAEPIRRTFPEAKVGGPGNAGLTNEPLPGFLDRCRNQAIQLDFLSWHLYHNDPSLHAGQVRAARNLIRDWPGPAPELMVTEFSPGFPAYSLEDEAFDPMRAATLAAAILEMYEAGVDYTFHYHLWDQVCYADDFSPFCSQKGVANMLRHWNEAPHQFGLFGVGEEVRPQYFVYQMLGRLDGERLHAESDTAELRVLAGKQEGGTAVMVANGRAGAANQDRVISLQFVGLEPGEKTLTVYRIDDRRRWNEETLEMAPVERRPVYTRERYECQLFLPAGTVAMAVLKKT